MNIQQDAHEVPSPRLGKWFRLFFRVIFIILILNFIYCAADIYFLKFPEISDLETHQGNLVSISGECIGAKSDRIHFKIDESNGHKISFTVGGGNNYFQTFSAGIGNTALHVNVRSSLQLYFGNDRKVRTTAAATKLD